MTATTQTHKLFTMFFLPAVYLRHLLKQEKNGLNDQQKSYQKGIYNQRNPEK